MVTYGNVWPMPVWLGKDDGTADGSTPSAADVVQKLGASPLTAPEDAKLRDVRDLVTKKKYADARLLLWAYGWQLSAEVATDVIQELGASPFEASDDVKDSAVRKRLGHEDYGAVRRLLWAYYRKELVAAVRVAGDRRRRAQGDDATERSDRYELYIDLFFVGEKFDNRLREIQKKTKRRVFVYVTGAMRNAILPQHRWHVYDELALALAFYCLKPRLYVAFLDNEVRQAIKALVESSIRKSVRVVAEEMGKTPAQSAAEDTIAELVKEGFDELLEPADEKARMRHEVPAAPEGRALKEAREIVDHLTDVCVRAPEEYPYLSRSIAVRWLCFLFATTRETKPERAETRIDDLNRLLRGLPSGRVAVGCEVLDAPESVGDNIDVPLLDEYREFYRSIQEMPSEWRGVARMLFGGRLGPDCVSPENRQEKSRRKYIESLLEMTSEEIQEQRKQIDDWLAHRPGAQK